MWYSDWGYREHGKVHARLTFNPYSSVSEHHETLSHEMLLDDAAATAPMVAVTDEAQDVSFANLLSRRFTHLKRRHRA